MAGYDHGLHRWRSRLGDRPERPYDPVKEEALRQRARMINPRFAGKIESAPPKGGDGWPKEP